MQKQGNELIVAQASSDRCGSSKSASRLWHRHPGFKTETVFPAVAGAPHQMPR